MSPAPNPIVTEISRLVESVMSIVMRVGIGTLALCALVGLLLTIRYLWRLGRRQLRSPVKLARVTPADTVPLVPGINAVERDLTGPRRARISPK